jgi:hypothetical protein
MALKYNNTEVQNVTYNGQEVQKVVYNGATVWEAGTWYPVQYYDWENNLVNVAPTELNVSTSYIDTIRSQYIQIGGNWKTGVKKVRISGEIIFGNSSTDTYTQPLNNAIAEITEIGQQFIIADVYSTEYIKVTLGTVSNGTAYTVYFSGSGSIDSGPSTNFYAKRIKITSFEEYR